jgi:hypothetical protein
MCAKTSAPTWGIREVTYLNMMVNKDDLEDLYQCTVKHTSLISTVVCQNIRNDELVGFIEGKLNDILYLLNKVYNPDLLNLKQQARLYYQKWLALKDKEPKTANAVYMEYLQMKAQINTIEFPVECPF